MKTRITDIRERFYDGADLVIDFATLGEYGFEAPPQSPRTQQADCPPEPCVPGRAHEATTALQRRAARLERFAA